MIYVITTIVLITIILFLFAQYKKTENYSDGAYTQLVAKDVQDTYLTGDAWKYIPIYDYTYSYTPYNFSFYPYTYYPYRYRPYYWPIRSQRRLRRRYRLL